MFRSPIRTTFAALSFGSLTLVASALAPTAASAHHVPHFKIGHHHKIHYWHRASIRSSTAAFTAATSPSAARIVVRRRCY
jgi:hypothetical protein